MSLLPDVFKPSDVKDDELLPDGDYLFEITKSSMKDTKNGKGKYLSLSMKVVDSENKDYIGSMVFENLNIVNENDTAVRIAEKQLKNLCEALGLDEVEDSQEMHGIPFVGVVTTVSGKGDYPDSNKIKMYKTESEFSS